MAIAAACAIADRSATGERCYPAAMHHQCFALPQMISTDAAIASAPVA
ncbi:hypothetical protein [Poseidonocella sp. HB161398]|nr:hypothetical protein [Poseidonocella sp. HB161398]